MKSTIRTFALATSLIAITLSMMATNAAALTRKAGDRPVEVHDHLSRRPRVFQQHGHQKSSPCC